MNLRYIIQKIKNFIFICRYNNVSLYKTKDFNMAKGSARKLQYWLNKGYCEAEAERMRLSRTPGTLEYFTIFKKMSNDEAIKAKDEYQSKRAITLENMIRKYGDVEGEIRWQQYKDKQAYTNSYEYKRDKYGWSYDEWDVYNKSRGHANISNPNFNTSYYERWVSKYGKDIADSMNAEVSTRKARYGNSNGNYGRPKRIEELERMRQSAIERVIRQGTAVGYNPNSIPILEEYARENNYVIQHAENGGEFQVPNTTFFVDAYDSNKNVVIEYDEKYHLHVEQIKKDEYRQRIIGNILKCKFIRILQSGEIRIFDYSKNKH